MKYLSLILFLFFVPFLKAQNIKLSKEIKVGGNLGWDYLSVDEASQRLFVSHGNVVNVIDLKTEKVIGTISDTKGVHGIAIANDLNKAFITDGAENAVTVINLNTFELIEKVAIQGIKPDAVLYDKFSKKVFVFNAKTNDATVLDALTNKVVKTIPLDGKPEFSVTNAKGLVYVNIEDKNQIKVIDATKLEVLHSWDISPGDEPSGLAFDSDNNRLFSVCGNSILVVTNADTGKVITKLPIDEGSDGVFFDEKRKLVFSSNGSGTLSVIKQKDKDHYAVLQTVKTAKGARTLTMSKATGTLYLPTASFGEAPAATNDNPNPRAPITPDSFKILVLK
ncbi:YVTN family beta-propeller protein [Flavobacterium sp. 90]|uniref:YncE family protein n=1 Tax=Flavobacterium sp. 90 TaxID=2135622 RepID=UPI0010449489|nr:YncE family protein [Flavobacterium sp. 90]TCK56301.1 YVTN family beta-propeller protein [Flavobacterium sp. 90]